MALSVNLILYIILVGLTEAMYVWLVAAGLSLTFGVLRIVNFAHGSLYMLGAYFAFTWIKLLGGNFWTALIVAPLVLAVVGYGMERFFFRPIYRLAFPFQLLLTFSFVLVFDELVRIIWGPIHQTASVPSILSGSVSISDFLFPIYNLFVLGAGSVVALGLWFLIEKTTWGVLTQCTSTDREMAASLGIRVPRIYTGVFMFGAWLAGIGGVLSAPLRSISPGMGELIIIEAFVVVVIGSLGSLKGAFLGAMMIGIFHAFGVMYFPIFELVIAYIVMAGVLIIRPQGLFGAT